MTASTSEKSGGCWSRYRVTVEPVMAVMFLALTFNGSPLTDLVIKQACGQLHMDVDSCKKDDSADNEVHRTSSTITLWRIIIDTLPGCIMSLFTSPWSETNGRKPVLVVSLIGVTLSQAILTYMSTIKEINPYWYLVAVIPSSISGGGILIMLSCYCYIIDVTLPKERILRLTILSGFVAVISVVGNLITPVLTDMGYLVLFGTCTILFLVTLLYVIFLVPESVEVKRGHAKTLFTMDHLVDSFHTFLKKRPNHVRGAIFALTGSGVVGILVATGEPDCKYLALIKRFDWTLADYSEFNAVVLVIQAIGTLSGVFLLMNLFGLGESSSIIVIQVTFLLSSLLTAISSTSLMFYIASQIRIFNGCMGPLLKGYISKLVPPHDVAKVIAFGSSLEAFMPQIGAVLYSNVYNQTVGFYPFSIFFMSSLLNLLVLIWLIIGLTILHRGRKDGEGKTESDEANGNIRDNAVKDVELPQS